MCSSDLGSLALITVFNAGDGLPFNPNLGITDNSGQEILAIRPNWNGTPVQYNPRDPDHYIANPEVFSEPPAGTIGTAGRDMLRGAGFWQWDFTLSKSTQITERLNATFRWEVYNLLNRANFGLLHDDFTRGTFGTFDSTPDVDAINPLAEGGPRTMQFALKFRF